MASVKRWAPPGNELLKVKKARFDGGESSQPSSSVQRVILNPADCDLDFIIERDGIQGSAHYEEGFAYCWSGARANVGIIGGKYCFGCRIIAAQPVNMEDTPLDQQHVCRVGFSRGDDSVGNLGETNHSFGFGGTGKFSHAGKFLDYGEKFGVGDTIICCVDLDSKPVGSICFSKNGKSLGVAMQFDAGPNRLGIVDSAMRSLHWESALFPHVLLKNVIVELQFSLEDGLVPEEGYRPWSSAFQDRNAILGPNFSSPSECEVIMMVGLPASGKTTWAEKWIKEHPEKRYVLLGTNLALDLMKVPGLLRRHNYGERFDRLMGRATGIFNTLLSRASKIQRNYIIDQTNVYKNARKRKLKPFANLHKIAVVVFPEPEELKRRADKRFREMGKDVPSEAVKEMLANFVLPSSKDMHGTDEYFDEVWFPELSRGDSDRYLIQMKSAAESKSGIFPYSRESSIRSRFSDGSFMTGSWNNQSAPRSLPSVGNPDGGPHFSLGFSTGMDYIYLGNERIDLGRPYGRPGIEAGTRNNLSAPRPLASVGDPDGRSYFSSGFSTGMDYIYRNERIDLGRPYGSPGIEAGTRSNLSAPRPLASVGDPDSHSYFSSGFSTGMDYKYYEGEAKIDMGRSITSPVTEAGTRNNPSAPRPYPRPSPNAWTPRDVYGNNPGSGGPIEGFTWRSLYARRTGDVNDNIPGSQSSPLEMYPRPPTYFGNARDTNRSMQGSTLSLTSATRQPAYGSGSPTRHGHPYRTPPQLTPQGNPPTSRMPVPGSYPHPRSGHY